MAYVAEDLEYSIESSAHVKQSGERAILKFFSKFKVFTAVRENFNHYNFGQFSGSHSMQLKILNSSV